MDATGYSTIVKLQIPSSRPDLDFLNLSYP